MTGRAIMDRNDEARGTEQATWRDDDGKVAVSAAVSRGYLLLDSLICGLVHEIR